MPEPHYLLNLLSREENKKNIEVLNYASRRQKRAAQVAMQAGGRYSESAEKPQNKDLINGYKGDKR